MQFNPILFDVAESFETERLYVRAVMPGDGALHFQALKESRTDLQRFLAHLPWVADEPSLSNSEKYCRKVRSSFIQRESLPYFIFLKATGQFLGGVGLHRIDWEVPKFEIGYWCTASAQGKGYVTEAVHGITAFAFEQLAAKRVEIHADEVNTRSWRVAELCGFELEGTICNYSRNRATNKLMDLRVYAKVIREA